MIKIPIFLGVAVFLIGTTYFLGLHQNDITIEQMKPLAADAQDVSNKTEPQVAASEEPASAASNDPKSLTTETSEFSAANDPKSSSFKAEKGDISGTMKAMGKGVAKKENNLVFPFPGIVENVLTAEGKKVNKGDPL